MIQQIVLVSWCFNILIFNNFIAKMDESEHSAKTTSASKKFEKRPDSSKTLLQIKKNMYLICHNVQKQRGGRSEGGVPRQGHVATNDPRVGTESSDFWRQRRYVFCFKKITKINKLMSWKILILV